MFTIYKQCKPEYTYFEVHCLLVVVNLEAFTLKECRIESLAKKLVFLRVHMSVYMRHNCTTVCMIIMSTLDGVWRRIFRV